MSYAVVRMAKMKSYDLKGIQFHNQRERVSQTNPDIDTARTKDNYDLVHAAAIDYNKQVKAIIDSQKVTTRKTRKDAVLVNEFIVTSDRGFFDSLTPEQTRQFFERSQDFFAERYGQQNIAYAMVHLDEQTPHMHLGVVPMRDGRLQGKNIFNRSELLAIQEQYPSYMQDYGFALVRGERHANREHLATIDFKIAQAKAQLVQLVPEKVEIEARPAVETVVHDKWFGKATVEEVTTSHVVLAQTDYDQLLQAVGAANVIRADYERLRRTNPVAQLEVLQEQCQRALTEKNEALHQLAAVTDRYQALVVRHRALLAEHTTLRATVRELRLEVAGIVSGIKEVIRQRTSSPEAFKGLFSVFWEKIREKFVQNGLEPSQTESERLREEEITKIRGRERGR